jgi:hypothetical protein
MYFYSYDSADILATTPAQAETLSWVKKSKKKKSDLFACPLLWAGFALFVNNYSQNAT